MALPVATKAGIISAVVGLPIAGIYYVIKNNPFLYEVEKKALEDTVYLKVGDKQEKTEQSKTIYSWDIEVDPQNDTSVWKTDNYSWKCTISTDESSKIDKTKLESKLPTSANQSDEWRHNNKKILIYVCSFLKDRKQSNNKTLVSSFTFPEDKTLDEVFKFKQDTNSD